MSRYCMTFIIQSILLHDFYVILFCYRACDFKVDAAWPLNIYSAITAKSHPRKNYKMITGVRITEKIFYVVASRETIWTSRLRLSLYPQYAGKSRTILAESSLQHILKILPVVGCSPAILNNQSRAFDVSTTVIICGTDRDWRESTSLLIRSQLLWVKGRCGAHPYADVSIQLPFLKFAPRGTVDMR
jgi:hypothetical protein